MSKKNIAVLQGGYTDEAEISYGTAAFVMEHLDRDEFEPILCTIIDRKWVAHLAGGEVPIDREDFSIPTLDGPITPDAVFMAIHGTPGEDGFLQEYFDHLGIPYNTGSAQNMRLTFNKADTTAALRKAGFKVADSVRLNTDDEIDYVSILEVTGLPCFVKPNNGGSSLGISKVKEAHELPSAIERAFNEDDEILVESFLQGMEVTCGVLETNGKAMALPITEVISKNEFFDYESKYTDGGNEEITPARLPEEVYQKCQRISEQIYKALDCRGIVRIDQIIDNGECSIIEINTVPGMSSASIVPQQIKAAGFEAKDLFSESLRNALDRAKTNGRVIS